MGKRFLRLAALGAALTANGLRPIPRTNPLAIPSFFAGWLTSELAVQNLTVTAVTTASYVGAQRARRRPLDSSDRLAIGLNAASAAGLGALIVQGLRVQGIVEAALAEGLRLYLAGHAPTVPDGPAGRGGPAPADVASAATEPRAVEAPPRSPAARRLPVWAAAAAVLAAGALATILLRPRAAPEKGEQSNPAPPPVVAEATGPGP